MKKIILVLALCLLGGLLYAQERVAVLPFTGGEGREGDTIAQILGTELTKLGNFRIVPRTAAINKVMEEHDFQRGGLTDGDTIVALGKGANADYVVSGHIQALGDRKMISASILDVETFQQVAGDYYEYDDLSEVRDYLPTLAEKLVSKTKNDYSAVPTLAILPFDGVDENNADVLAQLLSIELANREEYAVISRTDAIERVMEEQNIQRSGLTDADTIAELGRGVNAKYVVSVHIRNLGSRKILLGSILHVETFQQVVGDYYEYTSLDEIMNYLPTLAKELASKAKKDYTGVPTLSILPFEGVDKDNADVLAQLLAIELANSGKYAVVSRTTTIEKILEEQNIQRSGITDSETIAKLGAATNANYVLAGSLSSLGSDDYMNVQIIDVLTLEQENGAYVEYKTIEDGVELMPQLSFDLTGVVGSGFGVGSAIALYEDDQTERNGDRVIDLITELVSTGINAKNSDDSNYTPLMYASGYGYIEIVKALIAAGADLELKNSSDWTALMVASSNGHTDVVKELITSGADLELKNSGGWTALMVSARDGHTEVVKELIATGGELESKTGGGWTALILATSNGHTEIVKALIGADANLEAKANDGRTALILATSNGHTEIVKALIGADANLEAQANDGRTALLYAISSGHTSIENVLINAGAIEPYKIGGLIETVLVEAGSFQMGSNDGDSDEKPVHKVTLTTDYYMGKYEVTQGQWYEVMGNKPSSNDPARGWENLPVESVSWYDAVEFCNTLSELERLEPYYSINGSSIRITDKNGKGYRLPTEAEWEYAARGGKDGDHSLEYAGSNSIGGVAWYEDNSDETQEVGTKRANDLGIYDMSGNVWEWCWDWYDDYSSGNTTDPTGASSGSARVLRGGSYNGTADNCRVAYRDFNSPSLSGNSDGFRVVRSSLP